ncbi:MAG: SCP2 sterol-binding domain-containing protein [Thermoproteota archaeon]|jgi:Putative sterol carrier protein
MTSYETVKRLVEKLNSNETIKNELKNWNKTFQFNITDSTNFYVEFKEDGSAVVKEGKAPVANTTFTASDKVMDDILNGRLDGIQAFFSGQLRVSGDLMLAQRLVSVASKAR